MLQALFVSRKVHTVGTANSDTQSEANKPNTTSSRSVELSSTDSMESENTFQIRISHQLYVASLVAAAILFAVLVALFTRLRMYRTSETRDGRHGKHARASTREDKPSVILLRPISELGGDDGRVEIISQEEHAELPPNQLIEVGTGLQLVPRGSRAVTTVGRAEVAGGNAAREMEGDNR